MAKPNARKANGYRYRQLQKRVRSWGNPCALCGQPIDYSLTTYIDPKDGRRKPHPRRFEVDHIVPIAQGGDPFDPANVQAAHRICNQRKGDGTRKKRRQPPPPREEGLPNSGEW